jgi:hypothetical protein
MRKLISNMMKTIGPSHHFFRVLRKSQNSASKVSLFSGSGVLPIMNPHYYFHKVDFRTGQAQSLNIYRDLFVNPLDDFDEFYFLA